MSDLFSHQPTAPHNSEPRPDVEVSVAVPASIDHAWAGLIEHLHLWWPSDELSRWSDDSFFDLESNALVETSAQDDEYVWGEVVHTVPGESIELRWRDVSGDSATVLRLTAGKADDSPTIAPEIRSTAPGRGGVKGDPSGVRTVLTFTHSGWTTEDPQDVYDGYRSLWPIAAQRYLRFMGGA